MSLNDSLIWAAEDEDKEKVMRLIGEGVDVNAKNNEEDSGDDSENDDDDDEEDSGDDSENDTILMTMTDPRRCIGLAKRVMSTSPRS